MSKWLIKPHTHILKIKNPKANPMLIPRYWAQHQQRFKSSVTSDGAVKQATIKRYGWSDISRSDALAHAKSRVNEAHERWLAGEDIVRRERKEEYNESIGIPIREQIITEQSFPSSHLSDDSSAPTQLIVTRNSYGAQVANVDNIAIIDIDDSDLLRHLYPEQYLADGFMPAIMAYKNKSSSKTPIWVFIIVFVVVASIIAWLGISWLWLLAVMFGATAYLWWQASQSEKANLQKHYDNVASLQLFLTELIQKRIASYPNESFRLYETPAGFRIIATHDSVLPKDDVVTEWFAYFHADANYVRLCQSQQCFRARLTAKPWRMTEVTEQKVLEKDIPTKDFWSLPVDDVDAEENEPRYAELEARDKWLANYDKFAKSYKACRHIESFNGREVSNNKRTPAAISEFVRWHDAVCQVDRDLPLG